MGVSQQVINIAFVLLFGLATYSVAENPKNETYVKPKADQALVITGGEQTRVIIEGGMWINPTTHNVKEISLNTMDITVTREAQDALITLDFNRADIEVVFYVRVQAEEESVLQAAQSLGDKSMTPETLIELLEPKLDGALRAVAAQTEIQDLVQKRREFTRLVQEAIGGNLMEENGLILESVQIIMVNQTQVESLDPENQFDAQGLRSITAITTAMSVEVEQLTMDKDVAVKEIDVNAEKQKLELEQDLAFKEAEQQRNVITFSAEQEAETTKFQYEMEQSVQEREYEMKREVEKAKIEQEQVVQQRDIEKNLVVETAQIDMTRQVQEAEIQKNLIVETARIAQEQTIAEREIDMNLIVETKQIDQIRQVQKAEIQKNLIVETARIAQEQAVTERDVESTLQLEKARIAQEQAIEEVVIQKYLAIELARINAELEMKRKQVEAEKEKARLEKELISAKAEYHKQIAMHTKVAVFPLKHVKADAIADTVQKFLTESATIAVDENGNSLIIRDVEDYIEDAEAIIKTLDVEKKDSTCESGNPESQKARKPEG